MEETVVVKGNLERGTEKALLLVVDKDEQWVPKSQIIKCSVDINFIGKVEFKDVKLEVTQWIAEQKGWV